MLSEKERFMRFAFDEAQEAYAKGNLPVGAVLTIDDFLIGEAHNLNVTKRDWFSHAEAILLSRYSNTIKVNGGKKACLYTTFEPCLMCAGIASLCRVNKIIFAYPDFIGGASRIDKKNLPEWNTRHWPIFKQIEQKEYRNDSYELLIKYMKEHKDSWGTFLNKMIGFNKSLK